MACLCEVKSLLERLTFDQLVSVSEPKRVMRAKTVRGPPLDVEAYDDSVYYIFNFKSFPSTTGKRHKGFIKFFKPNKQKPLEKIECLVDCTCPDFRYRWAWANKQRGSSVVGGKSMNQALNRAPRITNPRARPGLCKHILALRDFVYGQYEEFDGELPDASKKIERIVKNVQNQQSTTGKPVVINKPGDKKDDKGGKPDAKGAKPEAPKPGDKTGKPLPAGKVPPEPAKPAPKMVIPTNPLAPKTKPDKEPAKPVDKTKLPKPGSGSGTAFLDRRFGRVESVVTDVNSTLFKEILSEVEEVEVDEEASEALEILREIRDLLRTFATEEEGAEANPDEGGPAGPDAPQVDLPAPEGAPAGEEVPA